VSRFRTPAYPPLPPQEMLPARTVNLPERGEVFLRDSGGEGPPIMLLHGWMVSADLNWHGAYRALAQAGYRVLAIDHRGHGRGMRAMVPFRLTDCAADAVATVRHLGLGPATFVGYSMGGTIAQLVARDHPDAVTGIVLSATSQHFQDPESVRIWRTMAGLRLLLSIAPRAAWRAGFRRAGIPMSPHTAWWQSELMRNFPRDVAEAGRELGRFDSRPWLASVDVPAAVVLTSRDEAVPPRNQRALAAALGARVFEAPIDHLEVATRPDVYNPALLRAVEWVSVAQRPTAAARA
jgi:pimeloyl-ACP methyl ester carboxylesterase